MITTDTAFLEVTHRISHGVTGKEGNGKGEDGGKLHFACFKAVREQWTEEMQMQMQELGRKPLYIYCNSGSGSQFCSATKPGRY